MSRTRGQVALALSVSSVDKLGSNSIGRSPYFAAFILLTQGSTGPQRFRTWNGIAVLSHSDEEVMLQGKEGSPGASGDTNLGVDVLRVVADGLLSDEEQLGYLFFRLSTGE